jgi:hypothetical protein
MAEETAEAAAVEAPAPEASETGQLEVVADQLQPAPSTAWTEGLDKLSRGYIENKGWTSAENMLESYRHLEKTTGTPADRIVHLPKDAADEQGWGQVYQRMGRPDDATGYELPETEPGPGQVSLNAHLRESAFKAGLSQKQAKSMAERFNEHTAALMKETMTKKQEQASVDEQELRKEWGSSWDENVAAAQRFKSTFNMSNETVDKLEDALGLRGLLELSAQVGRGLGEHSVPAKGEDSGAGLPFGMTPASAAAKIEELKEDETFMSQYMNGNKSAAARMHRLHALAHPDVAAAE